MSDRMIVTLTLFDSLNVTWSYFHNIMWTLPFQVSRVLKTINIFEITNLVIKDITVQWKQTFPSFASSSIIVFVVQIQIGSLTLNNICSDLHQIQTCEMCHYCVKDREGVQLFIVLNQNILRNGGDKHFPSKQPAATITTVFISMLMDPGPYFAFVYWVQFWYAYCQV